VNPKIHLAFVDDWELSGNGSGDIRALQFQPMRKLVEIYDRYGIRGSFNAEVMQQLAFREYQDTHSELRPLADEWDTVVRETYQKGHDIQLHIHPQWSNAQYADGKWKLTADWSILNYAPEDAYQMLLAGKRYLEDLLRPVDANYRVRSFRSGSWCIAPSPHMLNLLVKLGIVFDMSIVGGVHYDTKNIQLDYRDCEEDFLPYFPIMTDARRVSDKPESIICVPTNHFYGSRRQVFKHHVTQVMGKVTKGISSNNAQTDVRSVEVYGQEWAQKRHTSPVTRLYEKGLMPYLKGKYLISDLAQLDYSLLKEMLLSIRRRARASGLTDVPVILENHTKDVRDFSHIERFMKDVACADDINCVTLSELAHQLTGGTFKVRTANS
jgi:hypothetical protein